MSYLGIDIGTSGLRVLLVDDGGQALGAAEVGYPTAHLHPGWSEQDPKDWVLALDQAVAQLRETYRAFSELKGIGISGHMHGATVLDDTGQVLRPCILWNDTRSAAQARMLDAQTEFRKISGNIVFPGFTAPKLQWLRDSEPELFAKIEKVVLPAGYMVHHLTGEFVADISDSAGTAWMDMANRDWSSTLLAAGHMRSDQMPRLREGSQAAGKLRQDLAQKWGLSSEICVSAGAADNAASACGLGVMDAGQGFVSLGTSGVLLIARDSYEPAPEAALHTFCHAVPNRWYQMGVMLSAADSLSWLSTVTGTGPEALTRALGDRLIGPGRVMYFPYLSGERTPHNDADVRAGFVGIGKETSRESLTQAVLEGVCYGLRDSLEAAHATGARIEQLFAIGGGSKSRYWLSLLATVLNTPLHLPKSSEFGAALGAARLGMAAAGGDLNSIMKAPPSGEIVQPVQSLVAEFDAAYDRFRAGYPILKSHPMEVAS